MTVVESTLAEIGAATIPTIRVYNKIDQLNEEEEGPFVNGNEHPSVFISVKTRENLDRLRALVGQKVKEKHLKIYPHYLQPEHYKDWDQSE